MEGSPVNDLPFVFAIVMNQGKTDGVRRAAKANNGIKLNQTGTVIEISAKPLISNAGYPLLRSLLLIRYTANGHNLRFWQ